MDVCVCDTNCVRHRTHNRFFDFFFKILCLGYKLGRSTHGQRTQHIGGREGKDIPGYTEEMKIRYGTESNPRKKECVNSYIIGTIYFPTFCFKCFFLFDHVELICFYIFLKVYSGKYTYQPFNNFFFMNYAPSSTLGFNHAFIASLSVVIVSELGDKTWFIAAILAMRHSRITVFSGAIGALAVMTVLSACLGWITQLIPYWFTFYISTALFALFGLKMLYEAYHMSASEGQEVQEEAQAEIQKNELDMDSVKYTALESGGAEASGATNSSTWRIISFVSTLFLKAFTLTFLAEWGDRSQLTTIILGAREDVMGVIVGGVLGHVICTGIAVLGGRLLAQRISVRTVTLVGGIVFLLFAFSAFFVGSERPALDQPAMSNNHTIGFVPPHMLLTETLERRRK